MSLDRDELMQIAIFDYEVRLLKESLWQLITEKKIKLKAKHKQSIDEILEEGEISINQTKLNIKKIIEELNLNFSLSDVIDLSKQKLKKGLVPSDYIKFLEDKDLLKKIIVDELDKKMAGEYDTRHSIFLSCCSIWVHNIKVPLNTFVNSESSAGKSYVTKRIFDFFPDELKQYRTRITPQAFTYWHNPMFEPDWTWDGKLLYLEDVGTSLINSETFKVMCSEGSCATIVKDQKAVDIEIRGKPCILLTTATANPNNEIINRFNALNLDESSEQTHSVNIFTTKAAMGDLQEYNQDLRHALKFLQRVDVKIPYAEKITSLFPINNIRVRRDYPRFLNLIKSSAAFHQFQREIKDGSIIANGKDYNNAKRAIEKMQLTEMMVSLTHTEKKALKTCQVLTNEQEGGFKTEEAWKKNPFVGSRSWYKIINKLMRYGLLSVDLIESGTSKKPTQHFKAKKSGYFTLPNYEDL